MCLIGPVGKRGNSFDDVKTVQVLLNINLYQLVPLKPLAEDGRIGPGTLGAIEEFQRRVVGMSTPDGQVDPPPGKTLNALRKGIPATLTSDVLQGIMIRANRTAIDRYYTDLVNGMGAYGIDTSLRMAHFLAQVAHESGELRYSEEIASGAKYEGRQDLGNTEAGDGKRFKGRGLIQLTGRSNYSEYGNSIGVDMTKDANANTIATNPYWSADVACWFWEKHELNQLADADDLLTITKRINGGLNGLDDRRRCLGRAKFFLDVG